MKQIFFIALLIVGLTTSYSLAQMGHGMMRGGHMMDEEEMMSDKEYRQLDDILTRKQQSTDEMTIHHRQMINGMMGATQDIAIMMRQMSDMMGNITEIESEASNQDIKRMSAMMKDMAMEMNRISGLIGKGTATPEEVRAMQDKVIKMQEQMRELKR